MQSATERAVVLSRAEVCRWLPDFLAVVEAGCVKDAARALRKSAASIERSLRQLEREVASKVVVRPRQGRVRLTPVGALLLGGLGDRIRELAEGTQRFPILQPVQPKLRTDWLEEEADRRRRARQGPVYFFAPR